MIKNTPSLDLTEFIETNIFPRYAEFDQAHSVAHVVSVTRRALALAVHLGADIDMAYVIAAYHDLGMSGPRAVHHITGGKILANDHRLRKWFSPDQLRIMREAVEDHRASASKSPRSIYGKIIAEADRDMDSEVVFRRAIQYGLAHYPEKSDEEQWQRFVKHMNEKYSINGYIKLWIAGSDNERKLNELRNIIADEKELRRRFDAIYDNEKKATAII